MSYVLHNSECLRWMRQQQPGIFDAIIADPPYRTTNLAFDKAKALDYEAWWPEAWRLLKPAGVVVLFAADLFTVDLILTQRANYRYRLVWEKSNATGFQDANRRPLRGHEDILVFARHPRHSTYNPQKRPATRKVSAFAHKRNFVAHTGKVMLGDGWTDDGTRHPTTVLSVPSVAKQCLIHPTEKPIDLMAWLVRTYTNPGDTVLDCFAGSGSTLAACLMEQRHGVGIEMDGQYHEKALTRLQAIAAKPSLFHSTT